MLNFNCIQSCIFEQTLVGMKQELNMETKMLALVNKERADKKLSPLVLLPGLKKVSIRHSEEMLRANRIYHQSSKSGSVSNRLRKQKLAYLACAENVAMGRSLVGCHTGLMNSPGHRRNILNKSYTHIGIGVMSDKNGQLFITQVFTEQLSKIDLIADLKSTINYVDNLRKSNGLPVAKFVDLESVVSLVNQIAEASSSELKRLNSNNTMKKVGEELVAQRINYKHLSLTWQTNRKVDLSSSKKQLLNKKLSAYSVGIGVNKELSCLCYVLVLIQ